MFWGHFSTDMNIKNILTFTEQETVAAYDSDDSAQNEKSQSPSWVHLPWELIRSPQQSEYIRRNDTEFGIRKI